MVRPVAISQTRRTRSAQPVATTGTPSRTAGSIAATAPGCTRAGPDGSPVVMSAQVTVSPAALITTVPSTSNRVTAPGPGQFQLSGGGPAGALGEPAWRGELGQVGAVEPADPAAVGAGQHDGAAVQVTERDRGRLQRCGQLQPEARRASVAASQTARAPPRSIAAIRPSRATTRTARRGSAAARARCGPPRWPGRRLSAASLDIAHEEVAAIGGDSPSPRSAVHGPVR